MVNEMWLYKPHLKIWVVDKLLHDHVELPHDLDLAVHLVHLGG